MFLFINQKVTYKIIAWLDLCIVPLWELSIEWKG
jgi:hypothetical protein